MAQQEKQYQLKYTAKFYNAPEVFIDGKVREDLFWLYYVSDCQSKSRNVQERVKKILLKRAQKDFPGRSEEDFELVQVSYAMAEELTRDARYHGKWALKVAVSDEEWEACKIRRAR